MLEYQQHVEMSMCWWMQLSKDGMEEMEYTRMEARMEARMEWNSHIATEEDKEYEKSY